MGYSSVAPPLPAEYYRRHAGRVRELAVEAATGVVKEHLREVALQQELLAKRVDNGTLPTDS